MIREQNTYIHKGEQYKAESTSFINQMMIEDMLWHTQGLTREQIKKMSYEKLEAYILYGKAKLEIQAEEQARAEAKIRRSNR